MRVALTSDFHGMLPDRIPDCDAVVIAGDVCPDTRDQSRWLMNEFAKWVNSTTATIYMTWGNHDWTQKLTREVEEHWRPDVFVVVDDWVIIGDRHVYFSPWVVNLPMWAWNCGETALHERLLKIPEHCDAIVSHTPPYGAGDMVNGTRHAGSVAMAEWLRVREQPMTIVCGHIHEARGDHVLWQHEVLNVSSVDEAYGPHDERFMIVEW